MTPTLEGQHQQVLLQADTPNSVEMLLPLPPTRHR